MPRRSAFVQLNTVGGYLGRVKHASQMAVMYPNRGALPRASVQNAQAPVPLSSILSHKQTGLP